jgi:two-component system, OmpR family, heavy metal sensor histidine kinase CusS
MKSLSFKLVVLYTISVLVFTVSIIAVLEYRNTTEDHSDSQLHMEVGIGYLNGAMPKDLEIEAIEKTENINDIFGDYARDLSPNDVIKNYQQVVVHPRTPTNIHTTFEGPLDLSGLQYDTYILDISTSRVGPILLQNNFFQDTVNDYLRHWGVYRLLYYKPIEGYTNAIILASLDKRYLPGQAWLGRLLSDILIIIPLVFISALLIGWLISRRTVNPITRIARYAEDLSDKHLDRRLDIVSKDEIGSLARSLNIMASRLQTAFDSQKRFISDAAHGLKTPLSSVKMSVTGALDEDKSPEEYRHLLGFISGRVEQQEELINDLLILARADEGCINLPSQRINLSEVALEADDTFRYLFEEKGINFEARIERNIMVQADPKLMMHILSNLLENALKNTPARGSVNMEVGKPEDKATIKISDTGAGIPREYLNNLFERFYKVPGAHKEDSGFGLGLAICKSIGESFGGEISVESEVGAGTTFVVKFPLAE